jgi:hypothetical protein
MQIRQQHQQSQPQTQSEKRRSVLLDLGHGKAELLSAPYWVTMGGRVGLSVSDRVRDRDHRPPSPPLDRSVLQADMRRDGYVNIREGQLASSVDDMAALSSLIDELESAGLPAQFMLLFDEVWDVVNGVSNALEPLFGLANIQDFFVFHVRAGGSGWPMHRDRGGANPAAGFTPDGMPLSTTVWISLTAASLATSCIFCLPAYADPNYSSETVAEEATTIVARAHQHIRPIPVFQGDVLAWSSRLLHWGSASPKDAPAPRKTLAFTMAHPSFEQPSIITSSSRLPAFEARLVLVAYSLICYHHSQPVPHDMVPILLDVLRREPFLRHLTTDALSASCGGEGFEHNLALAVTDHASSLSFTPADGESHPGSASDSAHSPAADALNDIRRLISMLRA